jgi:hypothetical protein
MECVSRAGSGSYEIQRAHRLRRDEQMSVCDDGDSSLYLATDYRMLVLMR